MSDLIAPASGTVTEVNGALSDHPEIVSQSPFDRGWMIKVRLSDPAEVSSLLSAADYQKAIDAEAE